MSVPTHDGRRAGGEEYNPGEPTTPRQAATVILLRGGAQALEVLLVRRSPHAACGNCIRSIPALNYI